MLGLRWPDLDLDVGVLRIVEARLMVAGPVLIGAPKTELGTREPPLPADVTAALKALKVVLATDRLKAGPAWDDSGLVVVDAWVVRSDRTGTPMTGTAWCARRGGAGRLRIRLHDARHTSVTNMKALERPGYVIARWHSHDEAVMRRMYTHVGFRIYGCWPRTARGVSVRGL